MARTDLSPPSGPRQAARPAAGGVTAEPLIRLLDVAKTFVTPEGAPFHAVRPTTLEVRRGRIHGLVGRSGAGKSTLLRIVNLLERPDQGRVIVGGRDLTALGKRELREARQGLGMIFQQFNLLQNATVADNVAFPLRLHGGRDAAAIDRRVRECLALVGIADKATAYPARLSGGQKQRVAIARALAPQPAVLLCDEPTSALDAETTESLLATLADINRELGVTILIVTHELPVVDRLCGEASVIEDGAIVDRLVLDASFGRTDGERPGASLGAPPGAPPGASPAASPATRLGRELWRLRAQRAREASWSTETADA